MGDDVFADENDEQYAEALWQAQTHGLGFLMVGPNGSVKCVTKEEWRSALSDTEGE